MQQQDLDIGSEVSTTLFYQKDGRDLCVSQVLFLVTDPNTAIGEFDYRKRSASNAQVHFSFYAHSDEGWVGLRIKFKRGDIWD